MKPYFMEKQESKQLKCHTYVVSITEIVFVVLFGLNVVVAHVGGAALFSSLAHVAMFVFIWPARRKCFPKQNTQNKSNAS